MNTEVFKLKQDLTIMGLQVKTFPDCIGEAFDDLVSRVPGGLERSYYGISFMTAKGDIVYQAAAEVREANEPAKLNLEPYRIKSGDYLTVTLIDWRNKLGQIKQIFQELVHDPRVNGSPCIEWYKSDDEMVCMVRINT